MELYIGGCYQGKLDYVKKIKQITQNEQIAYGDVCTREEPFDRPVLYQLHKLIQRLLTQEVDINEYLEELLLQNPDVVIICDEVGMGVVPFEKADRIYRESVGRSCCFLAGRAERVERIICGLGSRLC